MKFFKSIKGIGDLFYKSIINIFDKAPILFTCIDNNNNIYICLSTGTGIVNDESYLITKINHDLEKQFKDNRLNLKSLFKQDEIICINNKEIYFYHKLEDVPEDELPVNLEDIYAN